VRHDCIEVIKCCITQTMTKCPKRGWTRKDVITPRFVRRPWPLIVSLVGRQVVIVSRQMAYTLRKCKRQLCRRIGPAEQHTSNRIAAAFTAEPLNSNSWYMCLQPRDGKWFACYQHHDYGLTHGMYRFDHLLLYACKIQIG